MEVLSRAPDGREGEYLVHHADGWARAWVLEEGRMDGVQAELLVNGGGLQRVLLADGLVVLAEEGEMRGTRAEVATRVAVKVLAMLRGKRWPVGMRGEDVDTEGMLRVRGKRLVTD